MVFSAHYTWGLEQLLKLKCEIIETCQKIKININHPFVFFQLRPEIFPSLCSFPFPLPGHPAAPVCCFISTYIFYTFYTCTCPQALFWMWLNLLKHCIEYRFLLFFFLNQRVWELFVLAGLSSSYWFYCWRIFHLHHTTIYLPNPWLGEHSGCSMTLLSWYCSRYLSVAFCGYACEFL